MGGDAQSRADSLGEAGLGSGVVSVVDEPSPHQVLARQVGGEDATGRGRVPDYVGGERVGDLVEDLELPLRRRRVLGSGEVGPHPDETE